MYNMKLAGGIQAGKFTDIGRVKSIKTCIRYCCDDKAECDLAFMLGKRYKNTTIQKIIGQCLLS